MDDLNRLAATAPSDIHMHSDIDNYIEHKLYDQDHHFLTVKPQDDTNFLDATNVIDDTRTSVKLVYNNKNFSCVTTNTQTVGRFHDAHAPSPIQFKMSAAHCILIKISDFTTFPLDMVENAIALCHELRLLGYNNNFMTRAIIKANRTRPHPIWALINSIICT